MTTLHFDPRPMDALKPTGPLAAATWVWDGLLPRGDIALLTGQWTAGKTTLLAGLFHALGRGGEFLGRACPAGTALVVSEESEDHWLDRRRAIPVGPHVRLVSQPFLLRPTPDDWTALVGHVAELRAAGGLDLLVIDPLSAFLPGWSEADTGTLFRFLSPLRQFARGGTAVLVLHHPRKEKAEEGSRARGGGALLGAVDVILELHHVGRGRTGNRRRLTARSRRAGVPPELVYEWAAGTAEFRVVPDDPEARFRENWEAVKALLADLPEPVTHKELLAAWPVDVPAPAAGVLYDWLRRAAAAKLAARTGSGTRSDPFRFELPGRRRARFGDLPDLGPLPAGWR